MIKIKAGLEINRNNTRKYYLCPIMPVFELITPIFALFRKFSLRRWVGKFICIFSSRLISRVRWSAAIGDNIVCLNQLKHFKHFFLIHRNRVWNQTRLKYTGTVGPHLFCENRKILCSHQHFSLSTVLSSPLIVVWNLSWSGSKLSDIYRFGTGFPTLSKTLENDDVLDNFFSDFFLWLLLGLLLWMRKCSL